ncbi:MAG TPA: acVLRF1 family peptidyl-tRNA hydrolase [Streptosporangiaceae bacterium]|nr:acVLRF1 family peptidyl-tRNA hydrolase [Streptosporangiaceae bacterium]
MKNPAAGGGRWVEVPPERLVTWIMSFTQRHGDTTTRWPSPGDDGAVVTFTAVDGSAAECHVPFPPLRGGPAGQTATKCDARAAGEEGAAGPDAAAAAEAILAHAMADRTVGVLLVRLGGYAVGVFTGSPPRLASSKVGRRLVHGRSAAGGWSQHRFARRRENQAAAALRAAADAAAGIFGPYGAGGLDAVVLGGDKRSLAGLRDDARLAPYLDRATNRFLTVPDPNPAVLRDIPSSYLAIRVRLTEPEPDSPRGAGHVQ